MSQSFPAIVPTQWLASRLGAPGIVTLDATFCLPQQGRTAYIEFQSKHIPSAQFFDIDKIADQNSSLPHMLPSADFFEEKVGQLGINNDTMVIVYDNNSFMASARAWWTFRVFGHYKVAVLDGGLKAWLREKRPIDSDYKSASEQTFNAYLDTSLVRNMEQMKNLVATKECIIIDARSANRFTGSEAEPRPGLKSGHIPGSYNIPYSTLLDAQTGHLKSVEQLKPILDQANIKPGSPIVTTCGSGVTASILTLALYQLGNKKVPVYDGSWSEWGAAPGVAIETGS